MCTKGRCYVQDSTGKYLFQQRVTNPPCSRCEAAKASANIAASKTNRVLRSRQCQWACALFR